MFLRLKGGALLNTKHVAYIDPLYDPQSKKRRIEKYKVYLDVAYGGEGVVVVIFENDYVELVKILEAEDGLR